MIKLVIFDMYETIITHYACPLYFSAEMAADMKIPVETFRETWRATEKERSTGKISFEEIIDKIMRDNNCFSQTVFDEICRKRMATKRLCFEYLHPEIIPMFENLKKHEKNIALISNCFSEEAVAIRESKVSKYFDEMFLSYEQGVVKPDFEIYRRCIEKFGVNSNECIYVGDGGSYELEAARDCGIRPLQAGWYLEQSGQINAGRKEDFELLETPMKIVQYI